MTQIKLDYIHEFKDRHGKTRRYVRLPGRKRVPLPGLPGSEEFMIAYAAATASAPSVEIGEGRTKAGTFSALLAAYYKDKAFSALSSATQTDRRRILEHFRNEHGGRRVTHLETRHVQAMVDKRQPFAQRNFIKALRGLIEYAMSAKPAWRTDDPSRGVKFAPATSEGHTTWTEDNIAAYEAKYPVGTKPRLAMALMLYTGCRLGDVVRLGRQQIRDGWLTYTQEKNGNSNFRKPVTLTIPVHPELQAVIDATPNDHLTFLVTAYGKPHSKKGFGSKVREWCDEAGCPDVSSHGLRKAIARRLVEAGNSHHVGMAITGHKTLAEFQRYTAGAEQKKLAGQARDFGAPKDEKRTASGKP